MLRPLPRSLRSPTLATALVALSVVATGVTCATGNQAPGAGGAGHHTSSAAERPTTASSVSTGGAGGGGSTASTGLYGRAHAAAEASR